VSWSTAQTELNALGYQLKVDGSPGAKTYGALYSYMGARNYERFGKLCGIDLACNPDLAQQPDAAVHIACLYWDQHKLNEYADTDNALAVSNGINRGNPASLREPNGFQDRVLKLSVAKRVLS
jgi:putative chitinase